MHAAQSSITAENNAAVRALEAWRAPRERICYDPYAKLFLERNLRGSAAPPAQLATLISAWEAILPGVCNAILARTRYIDDCLNNALNDGLKQLVILGAGYDTRAWRFNLERKGVRVFELDHPATQAAKLERIRRNLPYHPPAVTYIPIHFDRDNLICKLLGNDYDRFQSTFFIWEGVTYYLSPAAVDATLASIAQNAPDGSRIVFDYFPPSVVDGTSDRMEARALNDILKQKGERIQVRTAAGKADGFSEPAGFRAYGAP